MDVLVVNVGSSSLRLRVLDGAERILASKDLPRGDPGQVAAQLRVFLEEAPAPDAAGHRVVHGGSKFTHPVVLDAATDRALEDLAELAPLHNPPSIAVIEALRSLAPDLPQVACFDTSFHGTLPAKAFTYAVPRRWREEWGVRRYGFHGLSHAWATRRAGVLMGRPLEHLRLVSAHIGAGASLAAVAGGFSVDTTMGFTTIEGLVMATRSGSVDPGLIVWVQRHGGLSVDAVEQALEYQSGLLGLSGGTGDLRQVIAAADDGHEDAQLAYDVYVYRIQTGVAAMTAALGGLDGLVFTGGAGQASSRLRADVCAGLGFLGLTLDTVANEHHGGDGIVSSSRSTASVLVVEAREDLEIDRSVRELVP